MDYSGKTLKPCQCYGYWRGQGTIPDRYTFENFLPVPDGAEVAYERTLELAEGKANWIWLLMLGRPGCGKSHLLQALQGVVAKRGYRCVYLTSTDLFERLKAGMNRTERADLIGQLSTSQIMADLKQAPYLILDDVGIEYGTDWQKSALDELLERRYRDFLVTVMASNLPLSTLPERIVSRFRDASMSKIVMNDAQDYRPKKGKCP